MRVLHLVHQRNSPAARFVPVLEAAGFTVDTVVPGEQPLPPSVDGYAAVIACGGIQNTHETDRFPWLTEEIELLAGALERGTPTLGLCLGAQLLTAAGGGRVYPADPHEIGWRTVRMAAAAAADPVLAGFPESFQAVEWHHYACEAPAGAIELARNDACLQAFRIGDAAWGTQFHIEVDREILLTWQREAPAELEQAGYPRRRYLEELEHNLPAHEALGQEMAERFARVAAKRVATAA